MNRKNISSIIPLYVEKTTIDKPVYHADNTDVISSEVLKSHYQDLLKVIDNDSRGYIKGQYDENTNRYHCYCGMGWFLLGADVDVVVL